VGDWDCIYIYYLKGIFFIFSKIGPATLMADGFVPIWYNSINNLISFLFEIKFHLISTNNLLILSKGIGDASYSDFFSCQEVYGTAGW